MKEGHLTFDYELFFGKKSGSYEKCLIEPTDYLIRVSSKYGAKLTFFVDSGYLLKLSEYEKKYNRVAKEKKAVVEQLTHLQKEKHDIQLHIHPHWEDSYYDGDQWIMNLNRFRLPQFDSTEIHRIVHSYKAILEPYSLSGIFAYRAGGWCLQPFNKIGPILHSAGIWLDSTVFSGGHNNSPTNLYDFRKAPTQDFYHFEDDPCSALFEGYFLELPITSQHVPSAFYLDLLKKRLRKRGSHQRWGDGKSASQKISQILSLLLIGSTSPLSTDGLKFEKLFEFLQVKDIPKRWVSIGHPKCITKQNIKDFVSLFSQYRHETYFSNLQGYFIQKQKNWKNHDETRRKEHIRKWDQDLRFSKQI